MLIVLIGLTLQMVVGLGLAMILQRNFKLQGFVRYLLLVSMGVPTIISGVTLMYTFDPNGYLNELLFWLGLIKVPLGWAAR